MKRIYNKFKINFSVALITMTILNSCSNNDNMEVKPTKAQKEVKAINNVLVFENDAQLNKTIIELLDKSIEKRKQWEAKKGFTSIQTIFDDIVQSEEDMDNYYSSLSEEEQNALDKTKIDPHSKLYYKYLNKGVIKKVVDPEDQSESYDINLADPSLSLICNEKGAFAVGDTIFQITPEQIKYWPKGDLNNLDILYNATDETDQIKLIVKKQPTLKGSIGTRDGQWAYEDKRHPKRRIRVSVTFTTWQYLGNGTVWKYKHNVSFRSEKKNWLGKWKLNETDMYLKGNWSGNLRYEDPIYLSTHSEYFSAKYPSSGTKHFRGNYVRISPSIINGNLASFDSTWQIWYNINGTKVRINDISITDLYWEVTGHVNVKAVLTL